MIPWLIIVLFQKKKDSRKLKRRETDQKHSSSFTASIKFQGDDLPSTWLEGTIAVEVHHLEVVVQHTVSVKDRRLWVGVRVIDHLLRRFLRKEIERWPRPPVLNGKPLISRRMMTKQGRHFDASIAISNCTTWSSWSHQKLSTAPKTGTFSHKPSSLHQNPCRASSKVVSLPYWTGNRIYGFQT